MPKPTVLPHRNTPPKAHRFRCQVVLVASGFDSLNPVNDNEEDMLDRAWWLQPHSRLACQAVLGTDDVVVDIPKYSINHAKEHT